MRRTAVPATVSRLPSPVRSAVAYLTNAYPRPSHSFIRREILALERQGFTVERYSIRPLEGVLPDPEDQREAKRTRILLDGRLGVLAGSFAAFAVTRPRRLLDALGATLGMCRSPAALPRHIAYLVEACRLVRQLEAAGIRHVHVHFGTNPAAVARLAARLGRLTYSFTVHGPDEFDAPVGLSLAAKARDAAFVVAISSYGRGQLMRWLASADWSRIEVVRCGVDPKFQTAIAAPVADVGLASRRLVCIARLSAQKGLPLLIEAAALLAERRAFELRIIGGGELHAALQAQITAAGLDRQVRLMGTQPSDVVRSELLGGRALVSPSLAEGLPVVMMEALGLGRPVVATSIAGVPELVDAGCGWLVPSGSAERLADAMSAALDATPATLAAMGEEGRRRVRAAHDADTNAHRLAALLRPLVLEG
ncbi:glycosyltransferase family 4 protein [Sphingosinicellaceae bacterium]|nr:glycosyltransferase family 4 protein [Sphingosinicellaceae bacterium]